MVDVKAEGKKTISDCIMDGADIYMIVDPKAKEISNEK
jgi:hypothetical protein